MDKVGGEEGDGVMQEESNKFTIPCVKQIANGNLRYDSGNSNRGSATGWRVGWGGRWEGGLGRRGQEYIYIWLILVDVWQKTTKFCKAIILQLKNLNKKIKKKIKGISEQAFRYIICKVFVHYYFQFKKKTCHCWLTTLSSNLLFIYNAYYNFQEPQEWNQMSVTNLDKIWKVFLMQMT